MSLEEALRHELSKALSQEARAKVEQLNEHVEQIREGDA